MKRSINKLLLVVMVVLLIIPVLPSMGLAEDNTSGLVAHYTFDGNFNDSTNNGNNGKSVGEVTFANDGVTGQCAEFKGGFLTVPSNPALNLGKAFTVATWIKISQDANTNNNTSTILSKLDDNNYLSFYMVAQGIHDLKMRLYFKDIGEWDAATSGVGSLQLNEKWSHVVFKSDGSMLYVFLDGKLAANTQLPAGGGVIPESSTPLMIGAANGQDYFMGKMDDLRIYNRALSDDEIKALYGASGGTNKIVLQIDNPMMMVDDTQKEIDPGKGTRPIIIYGRTMVPIRAIIETMGGNLAWDANEERIDIGLKSKTLKLYVDKTTAYVDGQKVTLDVPPVIRNNRTMVPLRFVSESLGCKVEWDKDTQKITISYSK